MQVYWVLCSDNGMLAKKRARSNINRMVCRISRWLLQEGMSWILFLLCFLIILYSHCIRTPTLASLVQFNVHPYDFHHFHLAFSICIFHQNVCVLSSQLSFCLCSQPFHLPFTFVFLLSTFLSHLSDMSHSIRVYTFFSTWLCLYLFSALFWI